MRPAVVVARGSALFAFALFALAGCSRRDQVSLTPDAGDGDAMDAHVTNSNDAGRGDGAPACTPGQWVCEGNFAHRCGESAREQCGVGFQCVGGELGCAVCRPGSVRCSSDPAAGELPQTCASDGNEWIDGATCNTASHEVCIAGHCTGPCDGSSRSYLGCDYLAVPTLNSLLDPHFTYAVVVANPNSYPVGVSITGGAFTSPVLRTVQPGATSTLQLPWNWVTSRNQPGCIGFFPPPGNSCGSYSSIARTADAKGAYRITSDGPIAAYQFNPLEYHNAMAAMGYSYTADASLLLPRNILSAPDNQHYVVVSRPTIGDTGARGGFVTIVGAGDAETGVHVTLDLTVQVVDPNNTARTLGPGPVGFTVSLGDVVQLVAYGDGADLTGSLIDADGPIAVFAGHDCVNIPVERPACDHIEEQLFPVGTWGTHYAVSQLRYSPAEPVETAYVRIVSDHDATHVMFDGIPHRSECSFLDRGAFCEFATTGSFEITSDQPISVTQFMRGEGSPAGCAGLDFGVSEDPSCTSDPAMSTEVPVEQYRTTYTILVPATYVSNFVNIVAPPDATITLDGVAVNDPRPITLGSHFVLHILPLTGGAHTLTSPTPFGLKAYGVAPYTSYMYPAGLDLATINPIL